MTSALDENLYKSARNIPRVVIMPVSQLNAGDVCNHQKVLFTKDAFLVLLNRDKSSEN
jgi:ribosomal protein L4